MSPSGKRLANLVTLLAAILIAAAGVPAPESAGPGMPAHGVPVEDPGRPVDPADDTEPTERTSEGSTKESVRPNRRPHPSTPHVPFWMGAPDRPDPCPAVNGAPSDSSSPPLTILHCRFRN